jgi:hypothetical protein
MRYTRWQLEAFAEIEAATGKPIDQVKPRDLKPDPALAGTITLHGGLNSRRKLSREQRNKLLYQAWLISLLRKPEAPNYSACRDEELFDLPAKVA